MPTPYFRLFPYGWDIDVFYTRIRGRNVECAIFCKRVSQPFSGSLKEEDNAPRRPSEVTDTILALKYRKIGALGFLRDLFWCFRAFFGRKNENIGLLQGKHPRFCLESADVYAKEVRCFQRFFALISSNFCHLMVCRAAKWREIGDVSPLSFVVLCYVYVAKRTILVCFQRWKGYCILSKFLKVFALFFAFHAPCLWAQNVGVCKKIMGYLQGII